MCGIFASTCYDTYKRLYMANQERGTFASSQYFHSPSQRWMNKVPGKIKLTDSLNLLDAENKYDIFLGHVQAPTSSCRDWSADTSHPFSAGDWIVAHNGVLENDLEIKKNHSLTYDNPVDSYAIVALLKSMDVGDPIRCIQETFSEFKGTFGCWIHNKRCKKFYIVRSGSTIYYNPEIPSISSVQTRDVAETIDEGIIYEMSVNEGIYPVGEFKANSPFLIL